VLAVIVIGMACGTLKFATAVLGGVLISVLMLYLWFSSFGTRHRFDVIINLHWARPITDLPELRNLLHRHSLKTVCASQRSHEGHAGVDFSYRVLLRDPERMEDLLSELRSMQGVSRLTGLKAEEQSEL